MKISVDGGALNPKNNERFGTAIFSENLISSLKKFDKNNHYSIYTFKNLWPKLFWLKGRISLEELRLKKDVFLALNQAIPIYTSGKVISFCHGLSYYFYPELYSKYDVIRLNRQLREMGKKSDKIIVSSIRVKNELSSIHKNIKKKIQVIPFGIPLDMRSVSIKNKSKYFLYVGMNHPIKNIDFIKNAFKQLKKEKKYKDYKLLIYTKNLTRKKLKKLYQKATALLISSYYESFSFPVVEALSQGCPVIGLKSAIIPELRTYVNLASNTAEFVVKMKKITNKPTTKTISILRKKFNWENYVTNLVKLY